MTALLTGKKSEAEYVNFYDPLLHMSYFERLTFRVVTNTWVIVHVTGTIMLLLTDVRWAFWFGVLNSLYLMDRFFHYGSPKETFSAGVEEFGNIARFLPPRARRVIVSSYNNAVVSGGGFFLNLAGILTETRPVIEMLARLGIDHKEFKAKADVYLGRDTPSHKDKNHLLHEVEQLVFATFGSRRLDQESIDYSDLFAALGAIDNEQIISLFSIFEIDAASLSSVRTFGKEKSFIGHMKIISGLAERKVRKIYEGVPADAIGKEDTERILTYKVLELERTHGVFVLYSAISAAIDLSQRYFSPQPILRTSEILLHRAALYVSDRGDDIVRGEDIMSVLEETAKQS